MVDISEFGTIYYVLMYVIGGRLDGQIVVKIGESYEHDAKTRRKEALKYIPKVEVERSVNTSVRCISIQEGYAQVPNSKKYERIIHDKLRAKKFNIYEGKLRELYIGNGVVITTFRKYCNGYKINEFIDLNKGGIDFEGDVIMSEV